MQRPPVRSYPAALWRREDRLRYADDGADRERGAVYENVVAVNHAPFVSAWRGAQVILAVVDFIGAVPVFVFDDCASLPIFVFDVRVIVVMVLILGHGDTPDKTCGSDTSRKACG